MKISSSGLREAQQHPARGSGAGRGGGGEDARDLGVVQARDDRRDHDADRHAGRGERGDRLEAALGARGARLEPARELGVERGDRAHDVRRAVRGERREEVGVARDQRRLGDHRDGIPELEEDLEAAPRESEPALDRLIAVGVAGERDDLAAASAASGSVARSSSGASSFTMMRRSKSRPALKPRYSCEGRA